MALLLNYDIHVACMYHYALLLIVIVSWHLQKDAALKIVHSPFSFLQRNVIIIDLRFLIGISKKNWFQKC